MPLITTSAEDYCLMIEKMHENRLCKRYKSDVTVSLALKKNGICNYYWVAARPFSRRKTFKGEFLSEQDAYEGAQCGFYVSYDGNIVLNMATPASYVNGKNLRQARHLHLYDIDTREVWTVKLLPGVHKDNGIQTEIVSCDVTQSSMYLDDTFLEWSSKYSFDKEVFSEDETEFETSVVEIRKIFAKRSKVTPVFILYRNVSQMSHLVKKLDEIQIRNVYVKDLNESTEPCMCDIL